MNWKLQTTIILIIIAIFATMGYIIKTQHDSLQQQKSIEESVVLMKQLSDDIVRNQAQYATKQDIEKFASDSGINLSPIKDDLKKLNADVSSISVVIANSSGYKGTDIHTSNVTPRTDIPVISTVTCKDGTKLDCPNQDKFNYFTGQQNLKLEEPFVGSKSIPWGVVGFSAWKENPWDITIYPREYHLGTVLGVDENNRHFAYSQFWVESNGQRYNVQVSNAQFEEIYPVSKFSFNPSLYLGLNAGAIITPLRADVVPSLEVSLFSYGKTKILPTWTFLSLGVGYETQTKNVGMILSPINYNLGSSVSFLHNLYIGPSVGLDLLGNFSILGGVRVGL